MYIAFLVLFAAIPSSGTGAKLSERNLLGKTALREFLRWKREFYSKLLHSPWRADASKFRCIWGFPRYFNTSAFGKFLPSIFNYFQRRKSKLHWATGYCGL